MDIFRQPPTSKGPAETFTGDVWVDPVYAGSRPGQARLAVVRFAPGARSHWHSHRLGQTLHRAYMEELMPHILNGDIHPGRVFDRTVDLEDVAEGYRLMNDREALKVLVRP
jgi:threonine dehydrogenase-like Zn-dependent dehydrogenase